MNDIGQMNRKVGLEPRNSESALPWTLAARHSTLVGPQPPEIRSLSFTRCTPCAALHAQRLRLAYILAASHSGSTLLAMLLGSHPEVCTVGELKGVRGNPESYRCSCGTMIRECSFWKEVNRQMSLRGFPFDITDARTRIDDSKDRFILRLLGPLHRGIMLECLRDMALNFSPRWCEHLRTIQSRNAALVEALSEITGASVVVDSSKTGLRLKYLLRNPNLEVSVIRVLRDGRAVSLTHTNPAEFADATDPRLRSGGTGEPGHIGLSMHDAAMLWRKSNEEADRVTARLHPSQWMEVRYERLCQHPDEALQSVFQFLGVSPFSVQADFRRRKQQHLVGNGMRLDSSSEIHLDERWKTQLTAEDLKTFDRVAGDLNRKYGYV